MELMLMRVMKSKVFLFSGIDCFNFILFHKECGLW